MYSKYSVNRLLSTFDVIARLLLQQNHWFWSTQNSTGQLKAAFPSFRSNAAVEIYEHLYKFVPSKKKHTFSLIKLFHWFQIKMWLLLQLDWCDPRKSWAILFW